MDKEIKYYHWFNFNNKILSHNLKVGKGELCSSSAGRVLTGSDGFINLYHLGVLAGLNKEKEEIFEKIRKEEFFTLPSRRDTLWLFDDYILANKKGEDWGFVKQHCFV